MVHIHLPISKSIANRVLLLQAIHRDPLMRVSSDMPDDVIVLHDALQNLYQHKPGTQQTLYLKNCGTALRFLQVHIARFYPLEPIFLDGDERLKERDGAPTSQTTSARILHGEDIPVKPNESPYITMSRTMTAHYKPDMSEFLEADWSSAAFWYEYIAIHGGELLLQGLTEHSLQGDKAVADIYSKYFRVDTEFSDQGARIYRSANSKDSNFVDTVHIDFENTPDLYPAVALTCERMGITLQATGTERLHHKESDRLEAVRLHQVRNDHRMALALLMADYPISTEDQQCIAKSYPISLLSEALTTMA